jgi:hypothetical protein
VVSYVAISVEWTSTIKEDTVNQNRHVSHRSSLNLVDFLGTSYERQHMQTFFKGLNSKYFPVKLVEEVLEDGAVTDLISSSLALARKREQAMKASQDVIHENEGKGELSPWLRRTDWKTIFKDRDMKTLTKFIDGEAIATLEFKKVSRSVERVVNYCLDGVKDLDERGWNEIRFWLNSVEKGVSHKKPFRKHFEGLATYALAWSRLVFFCLQTFRNNQTGAEYLDWQ